MDPLCLLELLLAVLSCIVATGTCIGWLRKRKERRLMGEFWDMGEAAMDAEDGITVADLEAMVRSAQARAAQAAALKTRARLDQRHEQDKAAAVDAAWAQAVEEGRRWLTANVGQQLRVIEDLLADPKRKRADIRERVARLREVVRTRRLL